MEPVSIAAGIIGLLVALVMGFFFACTLLEEEHAKQGSLISDMHKLTSLVENYLSPEKPLGIRGIFLTYLILAAVLWGTSTLIYSFAYEIWALPESVT